MLLTAKPTGWRPAPPTGRIPSDQSKASQRGLCFPLLCWPVADPGRCVKNIPAQEQDRTPSSWFSWRPRSEGPSPAPRWALQGAGWRGGGGSFCRREGCDADRHPSPNPAVTLLERPLGAPACCSSAAREMGAQERLPVGQLGLRFKPGASSGAGCPAGFDWLQLASLLLVCSLLGRFWEGCRSDLSASFPMLSSSSAALFPPCERNGGSLKSRCPLGFQVAFHLFNLSLKLNVGTSFQKKKK